MIEQFISSLVKTYRNNFELETFYIYEMRIYLAPKEAKTHLFFTYAVKTRREPIDLEIIVPVLVEQSIEEIQDIIIAEMK